MCLSYIYRGTDEMILSWTLCEFEQEKPRLYMLRRSQRLENKSSNSSIKTLMTLTLSNTITGVYNLIFLPFAPTGYDYFPRGVS